MVDNTAKKLMDQVLDEIDISYKLIYEYDQISLSYAGEFFYQQETHTIQQIGRNPGITVSEIAENTGKTISACSQIIRKLRQRKIVIQKRNEDNCRQYNLELTNLGWQIYYEHESLDQKCFKNYEKHIEGFTHEQLENTIAVLKSLNAAFEKDIIRSQMQHDGVLNAEVL